MPPPRKKRSGGRATGKLGCCFFVFLGGGQRLEDALDLLYDLGVVLGVQISEADH